MKYKITLKKILIISKKVGKKKINRTAKIDAKLEIPLFFKK